MLGIFLNKVSLKEHNFITLNEVTFEDQTTMFY